VRKIHPWAKWARARYSRLEVLVTCASLEVYKRSNDSGQASAYLATVKAIVVGTLTPKITNIAEMMSSDEPLV